VLPWLSVWCVGRAREGRHGRNEEDSSNKGRKCALRERREAGGGGNCLAFILFRPLRGSGILDVLKSVVQGTFSWAGGEWGREYE